MTISKILGTAITSLTLAIPTAKAESQLAGAISNTTLPQRISSEGLKMTGDSFAPAVQQAKKVIMGNVQSGGEIINNNGDAIGSGILLQIHGTDSLANEFTKFPIKTVELDNTVTNVKKIVIGSPKITDSVEYSTEITYGDNQTTNILVSGLDKAYKFFKARYVNILEDNRLLR